MTLPNKIKFGPLTYDVIISKREAMDGKLGWCNSTDQTITLAEDQHPQSFKDTFLHEVLHAILWISHNHEDIQEERLVSSLTPWLILVMQDNPDLRKFLWA